MAVVVANEADKKSVRQTVRSRMRALSSSDQTVKSQEIANHLNEFFRHQPQGVCWGGFKPLPSEVQIPDLAPHLRWAFPRITNEEGLSFFEPTAGWETHEFGVQEPAEGSRPVSLADIAGLLVPGMAFASNGVRLGRGKGYYDRTLKAFHGQRIGVAFECQMFPALPTDAWDVSMTAIVTENGWIYPTKAERERT